MKRRPVRWLGALVLMLFIGWLVFEVLAFAAADRQSLNDRADLRAELRQQESTSEALAEQIRSLGEEPVIEPETTQQEVTGDVQDRFVPVPGPRGPAGTPGVDGDVGPRGPAGEPGVGLPGTSGKDGSSVTGPAGSDGSPGEDGSAGPAGPPGKDGRDGSNGSDGAPGKDGRSITSVTCPEQDWVITYSDGTSDTVNGPCRLISPLPTP